MNFKLRSISAALLVLGCGAANALVINTVTSSAGQMTNMHNVCTVDFNTTASLTNCAGTYSANTSSHIVSGSLANEYAAPDATPYLTVGGSLSDPVTITIPGGANYFGFYAGSIDSYNLITFSDGTSTASLAGSDPLFAGANANGSQAGYFNVTTDTLFTSITLSSSQAAFETDNHSFGTVPEPASIALLGIGVIGVAAAKRRRAR